MSKSRRMAAKQAVRALIKVIRPHLLYGWTAQSAGWPDIVAQLYVSGPNGSRYVPVAGKTFGTDLCVTRIVDALLRTGLPVAIVKVIRDDLLALFAQYNLE
jgi:hypothetical protein